jgi:hypothetical protein
MKKVAITQSNYIPWKGYFDLIRHVDEFILYDNVQYTRRDWRNRNQIKTKDGLKWLTIPVSVKGKFEQPIYEVTVSDPSWAKTHWATLVGAYRKAPFFDLYRNELEALFLAEQQDYLSQINKHFIERLCTILNIHTPIHSSTKYELLEERNARLIHICRQAGATHYYTGGSAKAYLREDLFADAGITVCYFDYSNYPAYPQLHGDFVHEVSILDLLFHVGGDAKTYFEKISSSTLNDFRRHSEVL